MRDPDAYRAGSGGAFWVAARCGGLVRLEVVETVSHETVRRTFEQTLSSPAHFDLFMAGTNGWVYTIGWTDGTGWDGQWMQISPDSGYLTPGGPVTAVCRDPDYFHVFMSGKNGSVYPNVWFPVPGSRMKRTPVRLYSLLVMAAWIAAWSHGRRELDRQQT